MESSSYNCTNMASYLIYVFTVPLSMYHQSLMVNPMFMLVQSLGLFLTPPGGEGAPGLGAGGVPR